MELHVYRNVARACNAHYTKEWKACRGAAPICKASSNAMSREGMSLFGSLTPWVFVGNACDAIPGSVL